LSYSILLPIICQSCGPWNFPILLFTHPQAFWKKCISNSYTFHIDCISKIRGLEAHNSFFTILPFMHQKWQRCCFGTCLRLRNMSYLQTYNNTLIKHVCTCSIANQLQYVWLTAFTILVWIFSATFVVCPGRRSASPRASPLLLLLLYRASACTSLVRIFYFGGISCSYWQVSFVLASIFHISNKSNLLTSFLFLTE